MANPKETIQIKINEAALQATITRSLGGVTGILKECAETLKKIEKAKSAPPAAEQKKPAEDAKKDASPDKADSEKSGKEKSDPSKEIKEYDSIKGMISGPLKEPLSKGIKAAGDAIVQSLSKGGEAFKGFGKTALGVLDEVIATMFKMAILNPLLNALFDQKGEKALPIFKLSGVASNPPKDEAVAAKDHAAEVKPADAEAPEKKKDEKAEKTEDKKKEEEKKVYETFGDMFSGPLKEPMTKGIDAAGTAIAQSLTKGSEAFKSFGKTALGVLEEVIASMFKMAVLNPLMNSLFNMQGAQALPIFNLFDTGGWTGGAPRSAVAGVVHGQEMVIRAPYAAQFRGALEQLNSGGGLPAATVPVPMPVAPVYAVPQGGGGGPLTVNVQNAPAGTTAQVNQRSGPGGREIDVYLESKVRQALPGALSDGSIDTAMRGNYGMSRMPTRRG